MACCVKWCCITSYFYQTVQTVKNSVLGIQSGDFVGGELQSHISRVAQKMGIKKSVEILRIPGTKLPQNLIGRQEEAFSLDQFHSFGNTILSGRAGVSFPEKHPFSPQEERFLVTKNLAALKINRTLFTNLIFLIVSIATTILLLPAMPIGGYFIGAFAGGIVHQVILGISDRTINRMAIRYSSPEEQDAGILLYEKLNIRCAQGNRSDYQTTLNQLKYFANLDSPE